MSNIHHKLRTFTETFLIAIHFNNHNKYEIDLNCSVKAFYEQMER